MERIRNKHKGKRIWVCGSGPSLLDVNPYKIPKEDIIICCNSSTYHFKKFHYAVFTDGAANYSNWYLNLKRKSCTIILLNQEIPQIKKGTIRLTKDFQKWKFNENDTEIIGGYDVVHCATHIAWLMGASEIILAGIDLKHVSSTQKHAHDQKLIESAPEGLKKTVSESTAANPGLFDGHLGLSLSGWDLIKTHNNLNIRSISTKGNLKHYPTISFNDLCN